MGRRPPPAVLTSPDDMLAAVRTSILLGAVVPELRAETETLAADLGELVRLSDSIKADQASRRQELEAIVEERRRLASLIDARQSRLTDAEKNAASESAHAEALAKQVTSLKDLIARLETELSAAQRNAESARKAEEELKVARDKLASLAFKDPARLAPKIAFVDAKGQLPLPLGGALVTSFGSADGTGGKSQGLTISGRAGAIVSAPCDGWISFAGPFRSFGQLLIINAGGGYYVLLAGMDRINVSLGQFVLAGEPVAVMGEAVAPSRGSGADGPDLYVEFRKDGGAIDPSPWWAKSQGEKVRG
jgi:septal ring factor EnvC (AmiA/AmiB activator)